MKMTMLARISERAKRAFAGGHVTRLLFMVMLGAAAVGVHAQSKDVPDDTALVDATLDTRPQREEGQSATRLANGSWLLIGGARNPGRLAIQDLSGPNARALDVRLAHARRGHSATLLPDGSVLIIGGLAPGGERIVEVIERYNPESQSLASASASGIRPRVNHSATLLLDGRVLIVGGADVDGTLILQPELYDPRNGEVELVTAELDRGRLGHIASHLLSDEVVLWSGVDGNGAPLASGELFDTMSQYFSEISKAGLERKLDELAQITGAPRVLKSLPAAGEINVSIRRPLVVQFNSTMEMASLNKETVTLFGPHGPTPVKPVPAENGRLVFVTPEQDLTPGAKYTLFVSGARDTQRRMLELTTVSFNTQALTHDATSIATFDSQTGTRTATEFGGNAGSPDAVGGDQRGNRRVQDSAATTVAANSVDNRNSPLTSEADRWVPDAKSLRGDWRTGRKHRVTVARPKHERLGRALHGHPEIAARMGRFTSGTVSRESLAQLVPARFRVPEVGRTAIVGQVVRLDGQPLAGVRMAIGGQEVLTDSDGEFLIENIPSGRQSLVIDGSSGRHSPRPYGRYTYGVDIVANQTNVLPFRIWLTALDTANAVRIPSPTTETIVLTNPGIPGLELRIPAGTVVRDAAGRIVTEISMTAIPTDQAPFPLPDVPVPTYFTVQPGGARLEASAGGTHGGAQLIYPNFTESRPGTRIDFWNYEPARGWHVYGKGTVSADGQRIVPDAGVVIHEFSGAMVSLPENAPLIGPRKCKVADPVDCSTGLFINESVDLEIDDVIPLEVRRTYRNQDDTSRSFGLGTNLSYDFFNVGTSHGTASSNGTYTYQELILPDGEHIYYPRISPGTGFTDAVYQNTDAPGKYFGSIIQWEPVWWRWMLTLRDGTKYYFQDSDSSPIARMAAVVEIEDRNGNKLLLTRDANYNLTRVTSPSGRYIEFDYDVDNRIVEARDDSGRTIQYDYDTQGRLEEVTDQNNNTESFTYDSANNMLTVTDKRGNTKVTNTFDADDRLATQTYADNADVAFAYTLDTNGLVTQTDFTDELGVINRMVFNADGYLTNITYALGLPEQQVLTIDRDSATNLINSVTDTLGRTTTYSYDALGNMTEQTRLAGTANAVTTEIVYSTDFSRPTSITDRGNRVTTLSYNGAGDLEGITDPLNNTRSFTHDARGRTLTETNGNDVTVASYAYLGSGSVSVTNALSQTKTVEMQSALIMRRTDTVGAQSTLTYNASGNVEAVLNAAGSEISFAYDENGNVLQHVDASNSITSFTYDVMNRVATKTDAYNNAESYEYDDAGNLTRRVDRKGQVSGITWDGLRRPTQIGFGATVATPTSYSRTVTYTWDAGDRLVQIVDSVSGTITRSYDDLNHLLSETTPQGTISYSYDAAGRRTGMTVQGQPALSYTWDDADRLLEIEQAAGATNGFVAQNVSFNYDDAGRRTRVTLPNGIWADYVYDDAEQVAEMNVARSNSQPLGNLTYTYDAAGRRVSVGGSLANVELPAALSSAEYGSLNELLEWGGITYSHDDNGNVTSDGTNTYVWNALDQLASITGGMSASFEYDGFGRRIGRTVSGSSIGYLFDGLNFVQEKSGTGSQATVTANLLVGGVDELFARVWNGTVTSVLTDIQGSALAETDDSEAVISSYSYEAYGGTAVSGTGSITQQYAGREMDAPNLYFNRARYYNPQTGRFLSEDPIGWGSGQANNYAYVFGNPITFTDPLGLWEHHIFPRANFQNYSQDAYDLFEYEATMETAGRHSYTSAHRAYNEATKELAEAFCKRTGINPARMTRTQAEDLIDEILKSKDPRIKEFLEREIGPPRPQAQDPQQSGYRFPKNPYLLAAYLMFYSAPTY